MSTPTVTPLRQLAGWNWLAKYRRVLGLLAFFYATAHLATFVVLDLELDLGEVTREIVKRPYITVGFAAWLLLVPLAVTSTAGWIRRLGKRWARDGMALDLSPSLPKPPDDGSIGPSRAPS